MKRALVILGSLRLTFPAMAAMAVGVLVGYLDAGASAAWSLVPLAVLAVNLLAAIALHPRFRRQGGLLVFHLCLLAAMVLALAGRMIALDARVEVRAGEAFHPDDIEVLDAGEWYPRTAIERVRFEQGDFEVDFAPGLVRGATRSTTRIAAPGGGRAVFEVGDARALIVDGHRFYTTSNKGFAAVITWRSDTGPAEPGAVHFPSWPLNDWKQLNDWRSPRGDRVGLELVVDADVPAGRAWTFSSAAAARAPARLLVRHAGSTTSLAPGDSIAIGAGRLRFERISTWLGYRVSYDPTLPWLLGAGVVGALGLGWHFLAASAARVPTGVRTSRVAAART